MDTLKNYTKGVGIWDHFTVRDGLPDMKIECLYEDRQDQLWIGTHDRGLARYNGEGFESFTRRDGLVGDGVFSVLEDGAGRLWIGTNRGLCRLEGEKIEQIGQLEGRGLLWGSCADGMGALWFGLEGQPGHLPALCCWRGGRLEIVELPGGADALGQGVNQVVPDGTGGFWCCSNQLYHCGEGVFAKIDGQGLEGSFLMDISVQRDGSIWVTSDKGLFRYDKTDFQKVMDADEGKWIWSLELDGDAKLWASTSDGRLLSFAGEQPIEIGQIGRFVSHAMCIDGRGRVWLGTYGMGVYCYDETRVKIFNKQQGLPSNHIHCVAEDGKGGVLVGTDDGLVHYDGERFALPPIYESLPRRGVTSLLVGVKGALWLGTRNGRLWFLDLEENIGEELTDGGNGFSLSHLVKDKQDRLWFGFKVSTGFGLYNGNDIEYWKPKDEADYPISIGAMLVDKNGRLLLGASVAEKGDGLFYREGDKLSLDERFRGSQVLALCQDRKGRLWLGTNEGVICLEEHQITRLGREDGLPCELVTALLEGADGSLWMGTEGGGVCRYDGDVLQVIQFSGEPVYNVVNSLCQDRQGRVWIGTPGGLIQYTSFNNIPDVKIQSVYTNREYLNPRKVVSEVTENCVVYLKGYSAVDSDNQLVFSYRLDPIEKEWKQSNDGIIQYKWLQPGTYFFRARAVDRDLNYSAEQCVELDIVEETNTDGTIAEVLSSMKDPLTPLIGTSVAIEQVRRQIKEIASLDISVLILGQTGTGKGIVARTIHDWGNWSETPFIAVNCGAISAGLADSELFGHEKGAFTGAVTQRKGRFEIANGGTIFLDEIGELPLEIQTRLLHVLQDKVIERVGGTAQIPIDVRIIAATNRDLPQAIKDGSFRRDLFYRLNSFPIQLPDLTERIEDIPLLAEHFVTKFANHLNKAIPEISPGALEVLVRLEWPGNVRELEHALHRAVILARNGVISPNDLAPDLGPYEGRQAEGTVFQTLEDFERAYIKRVLNHTNGVLYGPSGAAKILGMHPNTLRSRMKKLGIKKNEG